MYRLREYLTEFSPTEHICVTNTPEVPLMSPPSYHPHKADLLP